MATTQRLQDIKETPLEIQNSIQSEECHYEGMWNLGSFIQRQPEATRAVETTATEVIDTTQSSLSIVKEDLKENIMTATYPEVVLKTDDSEDQVKHEPMDVDNQSLKENVETLSATSKEKPIDWKEELSTERTTPQYETISMKGYISNFVEEKPVQDVSAMYKKSSIEFEKQKFHQDIFDDIIKNFGIIKKFADLERQYITQLRKVTNIEILTCSTCNYESMHKSNMTLHLLLIHKIKTEDLKMFKCATCDYTAKSIKYMQKHILSHKDIVNDEGEVDDYFSENSFGNDRFSSDSDWSSDDNIPLSKRKSNDKRKSGNKKSVRDKTKPGSKRNRMRVIHRCPKCDFESKTKTKLKQHLIIHKEVSTKKCDLCPFEADHYDALKPHKTTHKCPTTKRFLCYKCEYATLDRGLLKRHLLKEHKVVTEGLEKVIVYKCDLCPYETDLKRSLEIHSLSHKKDDEIEWFICEICNFKTKHKKSLKEHSFTHKKPEEIEKKFMCEICSVKFRTKAALKRHLVVHQTIENADEIFKCPHCPHKAKRKSYLIAHLLKHKDPSELSMFVCEICGFQTKRKWNIEMHKITHKNPDEVEIFSCGVCDYKTRFKDRLKRHLQKGNHTGMGKETRGFLCSTCNYETKNRKQYCRHVMGHKDQPVPTELKGNYVCDICGFRTLYKSSLQNHSRTHMNMDEIRTFQCPECEYKTKFKGNLKHHIKVHKDPSELTLYKCPTCGLAAKNKWNYKMHLLTHKSSDQVEMIKCKLCSYQTKFKGYMQVHLKKAHKVVTRRNEYQDYIVVVNPQQQQQIQQTEQQNVPVAQQGQFDFKLNL